MSAASDNVGVPWTVRHRSHNNPNSTDLGLNTWLPKIMGDAGYSIAAGTELLLVLDVGAVIGLLIAGLLSDARGNKPTEPVPV